MIRRTVEGTETQIYDFPDFTVASQLYVDDTGGGQDVYFDQIECAAGADYDIYRLPNADA